MTSKSGLWRLKQRLSSFIDSSSVNVNSSDHNTVCLADSIHGRAKIIGHSSLHDRARKAAEEKKADFKASLPRSLASDEHQQEQDCIALFQQKEIILGPLLGHGEFSNVYEVKAFQLQDNIFDTSHNDNAALLSDEEVSGRNHMKKCGNYRETKKARYAVKHIKPTYLKACLKDDNSDAYVHAARDLALEAEMLSSLNHPNIIKLRGMTSSGAAGFNQGPTGYFLIIDRLFDTLDQRMIRWRNPRSRQVDFAKAKKLSRRKSSFFGRRFSSLSNIPNEKPQTVDNQSTSSHAWGKLELKLNDEDMDERLSVALQISAAIMYLHSHDIIFRDLKPANIGFDVRGDVKIFDFGLARIVPANGRPYDQLYKMSGAGSPRYMAPECLDYKKYNLKADVYSFSIILWEMLAGERAYAFARQRHHLTHHVVEEGGRPEIDEDNNWPKTVTNMMRSCFEGDIEKRPRMAFVHNSIKQTLTSLRGGNNRGLTSSFINRRRSCESLCASLLSTSGVGGLGMMENDLFSDSLLFCADDNKDGNVGMAVSLTASTRRESSDSNVLDTSVHTPSNLYSAAVSNVAQGSLYD